MQTQTDTHSVKLADIPLMFRLKRGTVLHSELGLTQDARGANTALLSSILFPRSLYTLVSRSDNQSVVGQFRYQSNEDNAHIVYLAPTEEETEDNTVWLHILDAMAQEAGKHGAYNLIAEVEQTDSLFETMRHAGFAVYSRQTIWRHDPIAQVKDSASTIELTQEVANDKQGIWSLTSAIIPKMLQTVMMPSSDMAGWVYRKAGRVEAYIAYSEGNQGVYLIPYVHPDVMTEAVDILQVAIRQIEKTRKVPTYVCIQGYQVWLENTMHDLQFESWIEQAVMVKHLTAGVRQSNFAPMKVGKRITSTVPPVSFVTSEANQEEKD